MKTFLIAMLSVAVLSCNRQQTEMADPHSQLLALFDSYRAYTYYTYPEYATYEGVHDYNDRLSDRSVSAGHIYADSIKRIQQKLQEIQRVGLSGEDALNAELFDHTLQEIIDYDFYDIGNCMSFNHQGGFHIYFPQIIEVQPMETEADVQKYFSRLRQFPMEVEHTIEMLKEGLTKGAVLPCSVADRVAEQLDGLAKTKAEDFVLYTAHDRSDVLAAHKDELLAIVHDSIIYAYNRLNSFFLEDYMPNCRKTDGVWSINGGKEYYNYLVRKYTNSSMTAQQIFDLGMSEVERIKKEMEVAAEELGIESSDLANLFDQLRNNPDNFYTDKKDLLQGFRDILTQMDAKLPDLFGRLPEAPYDLKEIEEYRAAGAPAAYYYQVPMDGSRPGYFYVNTYDISSRPRYTMTALALHEAVPGHHLQIAIARELEDVPWFRNQMDVTTFTEGWGLYAEYLGYETGMYEDPLQRMGALSFEMWRACRLVVDVGLHDKEWTRQQAVDFMKANAPLSDLDIRSEVDRYISWPGQALAYKTGELKFKAMRAEAEMALGDKFDVKEFHDVILQNGSIPMDITERIFREWLKAKRAS